MSTSQAESMEAYEKKASCCSEGAPSKLPLALFAVELNSKKRLLFDVSSRTIRGVRSSLFPDATCEFENGGWLLMIRHGRPRRQYSQQQLTTVFLVHSKSGRRIDLPAFRPCCREVEAGFFVFYVGTTSSRPLVVARFDVYSVVPTVHVACPGDVYWSVYKHGVEPPDMPEELRGILVRLRIVDVALVKTRAVCLEKDGRVLIFDVTEMTWTRTAVPSCPEWSDDDGHFLVPFNGQAAVLVSRLRTGKHTYSFKFFKLDVEALEWSPMDDGELDHTSWFLHKGQSFHARDAGGRRKVYTFSAPRRCSGSVITNVYAHDLDDGTVELVIPASLVTQVRHWVHPSLLAATDTDDVVC